MLRIIIFQAVQVTQGNHSVTEGRTEETLHVGKTPILGKRFLEVAFDPSKPKKELSVN